MEVIYISDRQEYPVVDGHFEKWEEWFIVAY